MKEFTRAVVWAATLCVFPTQAQRALDTAPLPRHQLAVPPDKPKPEELRRLIENELRTHRYYKAKDGRDVHSPAKSTHDRMPVGPARSAVMARIPSASTGVGYARIMAA